MDLVSTNAQWFENTGEGQFVAHDLPDLGAISADRIRITDLDRDGTVDLLFLSDQAVSIMRNTDGHGVFAFSHTIAVNGLLDAGDIDADGDIDLVGKTAGVTWVEWNGGADEFEREEVIHDLDIRNEFFEYGYSYSQFELAQIDADEMLEIRFVSHWYHRNEGDRFEGDSQDWLGFSQDGRESGEISSGCYTNGVSVNYGAFGITDWDHNGTADGWCDPIFADGLIALDQNDGSANFSRTWITPPERRSVIDIGDFNNDGVLDILTGRDPIHRTPIWWDGAKDEIQTQEEPRIFAEQPIEFGSNQGNQSVELVDLTGSGPVAAVIANRGGVEVWKFAEGTLQPEEIQHLEIPRSQATATGDIDQDGDLDVVVAVNGANRVLKNDGGYLSDDGQLLGAYDTMDIALGDLDFDGDLDLIAANGSNQPDRIYWNDGAGQFVDSGQTLGDTTSRCVEVYDELLDGDLDVSFCASGLAEYWQNDGKRNFSTSTLDNTRSLMDLVRSPANSPGPLVGLVSLNAYAGTLTEELGGIWKTQGRRAVWGDVNNDGAFDLVVANDIVTTANRLWFTNTNQHGFVTHHHRLGTGPSNDVALGDVDQDGDLDAVFANTDSNWLFVNQVNPDRPSASPLLPEPEVARYDDHGNVNADATRIETPVEGSPVVVTGEINFDQDKDVFSIELAAGVNYDIVMTQGDARFDRWNRQLRISAETDEVVYLEIQGEPGEFEFQVYEGEALNVPGDANRDGKFNSADFVQVFQVGQFEDDIVNNSTWETGDWNGDGEFDTADFVTAFTFGAYEE